MVRAHSCAPLRVSIGLNRGSLIRIWYYSVLRKPTPSSNGKCVLWDCQYAIDAGDDYFAPRMKRLLLRAIALQRRRHRLAASTVRQYCSRLRGGLREILNLRPRHADGQRLLKRYQQIRAHLGYFSKTKPCPRPTTRVSKRCDGAHSWFSLRLGR